MGTSLQPAGIVTEDIADVVHANLGEMRYGRILLLRSKEVIQSSGVHRIQLFGSDIIIGICIQSRQFQGPGLYSFPGVHSNTQILSVVPQICEPAFGLELFIQDIQCLKVQERLGDEETLCFRQGNYFGEVDLFFHNDKRENLIMSLEECELLVLNKRDCLSYSRPEVHTPQET